MCSPEWPDQPMPILAACGRVDWTGASRAPLRAGSANRDEGSRQRDRLPPPFPPLQNCHYGIRRNLEAVGRGKRLAQASAAFCRDQLIRCCAHSKTVPERDPAEERWNGDGTLSLERRLRSLGDKLVAASKRVLD